MSAPAIEVSGVSKRYVIQHESRHDNLRDTLHHTARKLWRRFRWGTGFDTEEFWALRDISFTVQPGEVVGIIGRNGAGKSTLLKILSRITEPTTGSVRLRGRVASLLEVGTGFHPDLTGRENIYLNGAILGMSRAEIRAKFDEIVAFAEIDRFLDTPVKRYSSGMYVRLAFAVAAHLEPEILIVDEVLAVGDAQFQKKCLGKMQDVARNQGRTVLFVSHNIAAVRQLCSRAIWLASGTLQLDAPADQALRRYLEQDVQSTDQGALDLTAPLAFRQGDGAARFLSLALRGRDGVTRSAYHVGEAFDLEIDLECSRALSGVLVGFHIATSDQQIIVCSNHHDSLRIDPLPAGRHRLVCRYAGPALSPGTYRVTLAISSPSLRLVHDHLPDCLAFEIHPALDDSLAHHPTLLDGRPGLVRAAMPWIIGPLPRHA